MSDITTKGFDGFQPDPEVLGSVLDTALAIGFISPLREICLVSDRPRFRYDGDGALYSIDEPAIYFADGYGNCAVYRGRQLSHRYNCLPVTQWQATWLLKAMSKFGEF